MQRGRRAGGDRKPVTQPPIPLDPVDLLAGLAPGVELQVDDAPAELDREAPEGGPASMTVAEAGRMVRAGEETIRRLIRTPAIRPAAAPPDGDQLEPERAGVLPPTREKPGE